MGRGPSPLRGNDSTLPLVGRIWQGWELSPVDDALVVQEKEPYGDLRRIEPAEGGTFPQHMAQAHGWHKMGHPHTCKGRDLWALPACHCSAATSQAGYTGPSCPHRCSCLKVPSMHDPSAPSQVHIHGMGLLELPDLLNVVHEVSTIDILHHKVETVLQGGGGQQLENMGRDQTRPLPLPGLPAPVPCPIPATSNPAICSIPDCQDS